MNEQLYLVGHLQVMDEPLASLYVDHASGRYYLLVRLYVNVTKPTFLVAQVSLCQIQKYMRQEIGLNDIFSHSKAYLFSAMNMLEFNSSMLLPLQRAKALELLEKDEVDDFFDKQLSYKYVALKNYINGCLTRTTITA